MKMGDHQTSHSLIEDIWKFVRSDMPTSDFEKWIYYDAAVEALLGKDLYFEVISANYSIRNEVFHSKEALKVFTASISDASCMYIQLSNIAIVDMGSEENNKVFVTLKEIKERGDPYWWLSVYQCCECHQSWLVAQEERQNDVFCLCRLDTVSLEDVLSKNRWPNIFEHYEDLLRMGFEAGKRVIFYPINSAKNC